MRALKYGMVYIIPTLFLLGLWQGGWLTIAPLLFAFGIIPLLELIFKPDSQNIEAAETEIRRQDFSYDLMLYMVVPVVYLCIIIFLLNLSSIDYTRVEITGLILSMGVVLGGLGINVAHELGHRANKMEQLFSKMLLLPCAYLHFYIEHNRGHHKNVSTKEDPASARYNESLYHFWIRSVVYSYISAWKLEAQRLNRAGQPVLGFRNEMLRFQFIQLGFFGGIYFLFGWKIMLMFTCASIIGFLMLETVNYIEHYGLQRRMINDFRYEKVTPIHSWNSNHLVGRVMLFELSRHSDHHYQPSKKYQTLDHHAHSLQMPTGYPGMMILSVLPPLWFAVMNKRIQKSHLMIQDSLAVG